MKQFNLLTRTASLLASRRGNSSSSARKLFENTWEALLSYQILSISMLWSYFRDLGLSFCVVVFFGLWALAARAVVVFIRTKTSYQCKAQQNYPLWHRFEHDTASALGPLKIWFLELPGASDQQIFACDCLWFLYLKAFTSSLIRPSNFWKSVHKKASVYLKCIGKLLLELVHLIGLNFLKSHIS